MNDAFDLRAHTHLLVVAGSRAYGLHRPSSDVDVKGFAVPPAAWLHGFRRRFEQVDDPDGIAVFRDDLSADEQEVVDRTKLEGSVYGLAKFVRLAADANPHMLDALFCRDAEVRVITEVGQALRDARDAFLSQRCRDSFGGYAAAQLKRIRTHRRWLLTPPTEAPTRADFDLPEHSLMPREQLNAAHAAIRAQMDRWELDLDGLGKADARRLRDRIEAVLSEQVAADRFVLAARTIGLDDNFVQLMDRERRYRAARSEYNQHRRWMKERNADRAALEAAHGYDTKHAAHLVRLLRMALEIVRTGEVHVWRGDRDAEELQAIRAGAWSYDELEAWAEQATTTLKEEARSCPLPRRPDLDRLEALTVHLTECTFDATEPPSSSP
jgi:predicted nucleotidyltransferase